MPTYEALDWYDAPRYYDIVFDEDTEREATFLEAAFERYGRARRRPGGLRVLEPACGSGRLVAELARRGHRVTGFDASEPMLAYARERLDAAGLEAELFEGRMEAFGVGTGFDLAHCLVSTFKYLGSEAAARAHLCGVARALRPGGVYALGFHLTDYAYRGFDRERWVAERDGTRVVCNIQGWPADRRRRSERLRSRLVVTERGRERRFETHWTFRTYDLPQVRRLLASVPELEHVATHDFHCEIEAPRPFDGEQLDVLLILRRASRRAAGPSRRRPGRPIRSGSDQKNSRVRA